MNRFFLLSFENKEDRKGHTGYYLPGVEIKDYNIMIDGRKCFDRPNRTDIWKHMKTLQKLLQATEIVTQLVVYKIVLISKKYIQVDCNRLTLFIYLFNFNLV